MCYVVLCQKCGFMLNVTAIASRTSPHHYHHILHCIIPHQTPSDIIQNHTTFHITSLGIKQPRFTSCISTPCHHILPVPHLVWHCTKSHLASHHIIHILHRTLLHIAATWGWIRHNITHLALQNRKFHTTLIHITPCVVWSGGIEICGVMWNEVRCG